uniref:Rho-related GTP-binding protein RhoQ n=1 Tax=Schistocephalus solidus TaxID=70667 RepID=A0A0V0J1U4_SCHSO
MDGRDSSCPHIECVIVGDSKVGKSYLLSRLANRPLKGTYRPTMFDMVPVQVNRAGDIVIVDFWDTPGCHAHEKVRELSYGGAQIFVICFSVADPDSQNSVTEKWVHEIQRINRKVPFLLVGLQSDLRGDVETCKRLQSTGRDFPTITEMSAMARQIGAVDYVECSAITEIGLDRLLQTLVSAVSKPAFLRPFSPRRSCPLPPLSAFDKDTPKKVSSPLNLGLAERTTQKGVLPP